MGIIDRIHEIEAEMARTQKNKATEGHLGLLKARLAKLRAQLIEGPKASGSQNKTGFDVMKSGDARVALIGFPSVGKSTLLTLISTGTSITGDYDFTTLTCVPGTLRYKETTIQLLDLPGIVEGASDGKGRGRQVIAVARTCDLILMMLDASDGERQKRLLTKELEAVGIRLNRSHPDISYTRKTTGGIKLMHSIPLTHLNDDNVYAILHEYRIHDAEILVRADVTFDEFIDVIVGNRAYIPCCYVYNKIDNITIEEVNRIAHQPHSCVLSCSNPPLNFSFLREQIWEHLKLIRVYTKKKGEFPDFDDPVVMRAGANVLHFCHRIHRSLVTQFGYALVWGTSAKHQPQRVGKHHLLHDEDVVQVKASASMK